MCPTQYDLVESLPLVGHGVYLARTNASMINPFNVHVLKKYIFKNHSKIHLFFQIFFIFAKILEIAKHHKTIDTVSIQQNGNELNLSLGLNDKEKINACIPLFSSADIDLRPFIRTKLYNILMTFNVMQNADTCFENAYLALLAALSV